MTTIIYNANEKVKKYNKGNKGWFKPSTTHFYRGFIVKPQRGTFGGWIVYDKKNDLVTWQNSLRQVAKYVDNVINTILHELATTAKSINK